MELVKWMATGAGRTVRMVVGISMMVTGFSLGGGWIALAIVGIVPAAAGAGDFCLVAPILGQPLKSHHK